MSTNGASVEAVRGPLLREAISSPTLLSDLAGLEAYVGETYDSRSFVELLQNADDASASRFAVARSGHYLLVANDGRAFTPDDLTALCRSAASHKQRGDSIGYRGIGFKSVVSIAGTVHLVSGAFRVTFSRERTRELVPEAARVPLVRIPHDLLESEEAPFAEALQSLRDDGMGTIFVFADLVASAVETEFAGFDPTSLLFLRNVRQLELRGPVEEMISVRREAAADRVLRVRLGSSAGSDAWLISSSDGIDVAFAHVDGAIEALRPELALVHAFLPTREPTGFGFKLNADVSTDPSRTRVVFDARTADHVDRAARLVLSLIQGSLEGANAYARGLAPLLDPEIAALRQRSFAGDLLQALQRHAATVLPGFVLPPSWLNAADFADLAPSAGLRAVPPDLAVPGPFRGLLRYLGVREATLEEMGPALAHTTPTIAGAAEVVARVVSQDRLNAAREFSEEWRVWPTAHGHLSLREAVDSGEPLSRDFIDIVNERTGIPGDLIRTLTALVGAGTASKLSGEEARAIAAVPSPKGAPARSSISLRRWRSAEQQVLELLEAKGWSVGDVSRQNVGYDIEGVSPTGESVAIEVKSLDAPGRPFILTSNEEAVARERGEGFWLALVCQRGTDLEVAFVTNPAAQLQLTRQCRQWVYECAEYPYDPERYATE